MESYLATLHTLLHFSTLLSLSMLEAIPQLPFPFGMPPPPTPAKMTPYDTSKYPPPPPPVGVPHPPPPSYMVQSAPPPPPKPDETDGFNSTEYAYDQTGRLAREIYRLVHPSGEEFRRTHMFFMLESPTAKAISEYSDKIRYAKDNGGEDCLANGEEIAIKDFRKRLAEVFWNCETGWERNADLVGKAQALLNTIDGLDHRANETLKGCKPDQTCYVEFKQSPQAASIDKQLTEIRRHQLIDLRVLADQDHVTSLYSLYKCNADKSDGLRKAIYTTIAKMNVCFASAGLITTTM